ncbi:MAG: hypothetical protein ACRD5R_05115, partial [Candidatus Acidiferrales bacterium]
LEAFGKHPDIAAVGHGYFEVNDNNPPSEMVVAAKTCRIDVSSVPAARLAVLGRSLLGASRLAVRRRVLNRIGPLPAALVFCADTPILTLSLALGGAIILDQPLCYYRLHTTNLFSGSSDDMTKLHRIYEILAFLFGYLPQRFAELGVPEETVTAFLDFDRIELERLELKFNQGGKWKNFRAEMSYFKTAYRNPSPSYFAFKCLVGVMALLLPPRRFWQVRDWYGRKNLKRFRSRIAAAEPAAQSDLFQRRPVARQD